MSPTSSTDELDLHGFTVAEAIERFVQYYNARVNNDQYGCVKVIHGYGSTGAGGAIRIKLRALLDEHLDKLRYEAGDDYGDPGWTWVYPKVRLPTSPCRDGRRCLVDTDGKRCATASRNELRLYALRTSTPPRRRARAGLRRR
jgi:hypothetical protein